MRRLALAGIALASLIPALAQAASAPTELTGEARARIDGAIDRAITEKRIVGAVVLVSHDGKLVYQRAAGLADRESKRPMQIDTVFRLASVSKPIVSAAALALVDQGKLSLDDPVTKWLPDFRPKLASGTAPTITVRQLLTHTSGLSYKFAEKTGTAYYQAGVSDGFDELRVSLDENLRRLASVPLFSRPGEALRYSLSIDVLGAVVEKAAGKPLPQAVAELVTQPLNMRDTAFSAKEPARLAVPYHDAKPAPERDERSVFHAVRRRRSHDVFAFACARCKGVSVWRRRNGRHRAGRHALTRSSPRGRQADPEAQRPPRA